MDATLSRRLAARERRLELGGHGYTLRRPTALQRIEAGRGSGLDLVRACVVGWDLTLLDLVPGGDPTPAPFTAELWSDWLDDHPEIWEPISLAILDMIAAHDAALETSAKN
jgi:hypothetical protein